LTVAAFERRLMEYDRSVVNRWGAMVWLAEIAAGRPAEQAPAIRVVDFMGTIGGVTQPASPHSFGFLQVTGTPPLTPAFKAETVVEIQDPMLGVRRAYYLSKDMRLESESPFLEVNLMSAAPFLLHGLSLDANIEFVTAAHRVDAVKTAVTQPRPRPSAVTVEVMSAEGTIRQEITFGEDAGAEWILASPIRASLIRFVMDKPSSNGGKILRLRSVEFYGQFLFG
jgi:hypothetical protein